ncbi:MULTISPECIES: DUF3617 family protein [unclassified Phenylobacterium]|uniref:DUF3617 domain-containing protein n=1 Tax=unclassified Phenylobacterium TaxID=2640670 RepID=UPI0022B57ACB|nr:DUF3617 family protein [Phenylobacterium sp. NIBR 498073]MBS0492205.1 DUF3617 family protein [Pseudomonadota bacterium]WGU41010.1 DUF3617 family protein [Phenylobacterium sp. NIBR 498073]
MLRNAPLALIPAVLLLAAPAAAQEQTILPGYWDVTNKVSAIVSQTKTEKRCITPAEVSKFVMGPSNRHYKCDYPTRVFKDGKIRLKGACATKNGSKAALEATGTYSPTTFTMNAKISTTYAGVPLSANAITTAKRISETCPAAPPAS